MVNWIIVIVLVIVGIIALRLNHLRHRVFILILISLALFFYLSVTSLNEKNDFDFSSTRGILDAGKVYFGWLANGFQNTKTVVGNVIKLDWASTNGTFLNKSKGG